MLTIPVYNPAGEQIGEEWIDPADFGGEINKQLLHDVVLMHLAAQRVGTVNHPRSGRVAGSGKKLFRQKGTGNARVGAKRTNKRKGGGSAFARRNRDYRYSMPKKAVRAAIRMAILSKFQDHQALVLDGLALQQPRTSQVAKALRRSDGPTSASPRPPRSSARPRPRPGSGPSSDVPSSSAFPPRTRLASQRAAISMASRSRPWPSSTPTTSSSNATWS